MIEQTISSVFWASLIGLDVLIAKKLYSLYIEDHDVRKLMFTYGLLLCTPVYALAIIGIDNSILTRNIFYWSPFPVLLAFIFTLLSSRFSLDLNKYYKLFLLGTVSSVAIYFVPLQIDSLPFLTIGVSFASILAIIQYSKKFEHSSVILFLSLPSFSVCFMAIGFNLTELAIFAGFAAKASLLLAFEVAKNQEGAGSSILVLKNQLNTAAQNFSKIFSLIPDPAVIVDSRGKFLAITKNVPTITGYKEEELVGINFMTSELITAHSKAVLIKNLAKRMLGFHIPPYEIELISKNGRKMQFELNAMKIDYEGNPADMVIFRDLTERKTLINSLSKEQERFQSVAESSGDWIWEIDCEGKYVYSNPVVNKILGYTSEEIIGKSYCDFLFPRFKSKMDDFLKEFSKNNFQCCLNKNCLRKDGNISMLESRGVPVYETNGKIIGYRGVDRDITEKKELEDRVLKSEKFAAIGELATMVAHDLRNPLQSISASIYYVKKATQQIRDENMNAILERIEESVKYSDKIIMDLLDYSANIQLELSKTDPKSIINLTLSKIDIPGNIRIIDKTHVKPMIQVDFMRVRRLILNLITNAFEAMPDGGTLTIVSKEKKNYVELSIADTGIGIPKKKMEKLWTPFVTTKAKGMGLGLPICKRIVEAHKGEIHAYTKKGRGTTFVITIPIMVSDKDNFEFFVDENQAIFLEKNRKE